jgi:hypothetical protein
MVHLWPELARKTKNQNHQRQAEDHGDVKRGDEAQSIDWYFMPAGQKNGSRYQAPENLGIWIQGVNQGGFQDALLGPCFYTRNGEIKVFPGFIGTIGKVENE